MDYSTSTQAEDSRWKDMMRHWITTSTKAEEARGKDMMRYRVMDVITFAAYLVFLQISIIILFTKPLLSSALSTAISISLVVAMLLQLLVLFLYIYTFRGELVWRLHMKFRAWHARACVGILNWKNACATFVRKLAMRTTNRRNDELTHFRWTCASLHTHGRIEYLCCGK